MFQFFTEYEINEDTAQITGTDVNHIRNVLRMNPGDRIRLCDAAENMFIAEISSVGADAVTVNIIEKEASSNELPGRITLYQALPKGDRMDNIIQKTTELGVHAIVPVRMQHCVVKLDEKKAAAKVERYSKIAESAAKQCKRNFIPEVHPVMDFKAAVSKAVGESRVIVPYEHAGGMTETKKVFESLKSGEDISYFIGPEGGFADSEIEELINSGADVISLGSRILRTDTAAITALSLLMYHLEARWD